MLRGWGLASFLLFLSLSLSGCNFFDKAKNNVKDNTDGQTAKVMSEDTSAVPESVTVIPCADTITVNKNDCAIEVTAKFADGSTNNLITDFTLSVEGGNASIDASGVLSAGDTVATLTVSASYNNIKGSATVNVELPAGGTATSQSTDTSGNQSGSTSGSGTDTGTGTGTGSGTGTDTGSGTGTDTGSGTGSGTGTTSPTLDSFEITPGSNNEIKISAGEGFTLVTTAKYSDNTTKDVSQRVVWSWNSSALELKNNTSNEFISKPIMTKSETIVLNGTATLDDGSVHSITVNLIINFADMLNFWHGDSANTVNVLENGKLDSFYDPGGITATSMSFGGSQTVPGTVVSYQASSVLSNETLLLVYDSSNTIAYAYLKAPVYSTVTDQNNVTTSTSSINEYVWYPQLNSVEPNVTSNFAGNVGDISTGNFALTLCEKSVVDVMDACNLAQNQRQISGDFSIVRTFDRVVNNATVSQLSVLAPDQSYTLPDTTQQSFSYQVDPKLDYEFILSGTDVVMSVTGLDNCQQVMICQVSKRPDLVSRQLVFTVTSTNNTTAQFSINLNTTGFSPGSVDTPISLGSGPVKKSFLISAGSSHYYQVGISAANNYWMNVTAFNKGTLNMSVYSDPTFTNVVCADVTECLTDNETRNADGKLPYDTLYLKIDNTDALDDTFEFRMIYNYEYTQDAPKQIQDFTVADAPVSASIDGQVGPSNHGTIGNANGPKGSFYYFNAKYNYNYEISFTGVQDLISLYLNTSFNGSSGGISPCSVLIDAGEERVSCIVNAQQQWIVINTIAEGVVGTPYTITVRELAADEKIYQVDLGTVNDLKIGYPFATVFSKEGKVLYRRKFRTWLDSVSPGQDLVDFLVPPGDDFVYIRITDVYRSGEAYAMRVSDDGSKGFSAYREKLDNPDYAEPTDNTMLGGTPILYNTVDVHTFSPQADGSGDTDWFKFCTNAAACGL